MSVFLHRLALKKPDICLHRGDDLFRRLAEARAQEVLIWSLRIKRLMQRAETEPWLLHHRYESHAAEVDLAPLTTAWKLEQALLLSKNLLKYVGNSLSR